jgi:hypothetical protein
LRELHVVLVVKQQLHLEARELRLPLAVRFHLEGALELHVVLVVEAVRVERAKAPRAGAVLPLDR